MRPTHKEIFNQIKKAKQIVQENKIAVINELAIVADAHEIGYSVQRLSQVIFKILDEINPDDYVGQRPPMKAYEDKIKGSELFAFAKEIKSLNCRVYFKFVLKNDIFWLISLHKDRL